AQAGRLPELRGRTLPSAGSPGRASLLSAGRLSRSASIPAAGASPKMGSSHFPGERGLDFQEEVARVAKSIGHALDDLDAVVHSLDEAGVHWKARAGEDAPGVSAQVAGKALQRRQATGPRMSQPRSPAPPTLPHAG